MATNITILLQSFIIKLQHLTALAAQQGVYSMHKYSSIKKHSINLI